MGKKHYSGKELIYRRQMEKQRQQGRENTIRKRVQDMNQLKKVGGSSPAGYATEGKGGERQCYF